MGCINNSGDVPYQIYQSVRKQWKANNSQVYNIQDDKQLLK